MNCKTALLTGIAGAFLIAAPVLAQDAPTPQTPEPVPAEASAVQSQSLTLSPGATVKSSDGTELGKLVGVQNGAGGQELTVRGADGQVRPVPLAGIRQDGADVVVDATLADVQAAAPVASPDTAQPTPDAEPLPPADAPDKAAPDTDEPG